MKPPSGVSLLSGIASFVLTLAWANLAGAGWWRVRSGRGPTTFTRLGALLTSALAIIYFASAVFCFAPAEMHDRPGPVLGMFYVVSDAAIFAALAVFRHWTRFFSVRSEPASRRWLAVNYGSAGAMTLTALGARVLARDDATGTVIGVYQVVNWSYVLLMLGLSLRRIATLARGQDWRPGSVSVARRPDVLALAVAFACVLVVVVLHLSGSWRLHRDLLSVMPVLLGVAILLPFAVRSLGGLLVTMGTTVGTLAGAAAVLWAAFTLDPALRPLSLLLAAAGLAAVMGPFQGTLRAGLDRLVLRRRRDRWGRLQEFLRNLSPELGIQKCSRLAVVRLGEGLHLRGAGLIFRDAGQLATGTLALDRIGALWPRGEDADALISRVAAYDDLAVLPPDLREALIDADVVVVLPLRGSARLWGHLLLSTDLVGIGGFFDQEMQLLEAFADQLARIIDAADMLARVVAVERSLAHAEKLAAIGELAARVAHEIRNPVTAARSLAQLLAREPTSPHNAEHAGLILGELERVERQVRALLRFARREELELTPTDLGALLRETALHFEPRFAAEAISCSVAAPPGVVASVDREKLRQVLINLVENAGDALVCADVERRIELSLAGTNGSVQLVVADSGPGVNADVLPRIFEPFFSLKAQGTGLGLAIAKRTVEAHGGSISARRAATGGGLRFEIELPLEHATEGRDR